MRLKKLLAAALSAAMAVSIMATVPFTAGAAFDYYKTVSVGMSIGSVASKSGEESKYGGMGGNTSPVTFAPSNITGSPLYADGVKDTYTLSFTWGLNTDGLTGYSNGDTLKAEITGLTAKLLDTDDNVIQTKTLGSQSWTQTWHAGDSYWDGTTTIAFSDLTTPEAFVTANQKVTLEWGISYGKNC